MADEEGGQETNNRINPLQPVVLGKVCNLVSFAELKRFRLVCREWNVVVSNHPRLKDCRAVFRSDWLGKARGLNLESTLKWKSVYFCYFPWKRNSIFLQYWAHAGQNVTVLNFKYYKLSCTEMVTFLNTMPQLLELTFNQCSFEKSKQRILNKPNIKYITACCPHENLELAPGALVPPPLIRVLEMIKCDCFPLCLLDLLSRRTNGTLQVFHYDHARIPFWKRDYCLPKRDKVQAFLLQIIRNNVNTLRDVSFFRNTRFDLFLQQLTNANNNIAIAPTIATLGQQAYWRFTDTAPVYIDYIRGLDPNALHSLTIRFIHRFIAPNLGAALALKLNLRYLLVDTVWVEQGGAQFNVAALFLNLLHLETLQVRDRNRRQQSAILDNYLTTPLPGRLKSLAFYGYYLADEKIKTFVQSNSALRLQTLLIEGGRFVTDDTLQLIIKTLPQLEVFGVNDSKFLTDAGLTGLPLEAVKQILKSQQRVILTGEFELEELPGVPISQMSNLRKLSLAGCRKLSDITIFIGIKFPYLREIDLSRCLNVTDIGIIQLSKHNPSLERVIIMKNLKITHFGLNQVLINNPCIENIHTSKHIRDRKFGKQIEYKVCHRFKTAVTYCHWDERRARPMNSD